MENFWDIYKRDLKKIAVAALGTICLLFAINYSSQYLPNTGSFILLVKTLLKEFAYFAFYCLLLAFFFRSGRGKFSELLLRYFYVPFILAVCGVVVALASAHLSVYLFTSGINLYIGGFYIPKSWLAIPTAILDIFVRLTILFVFFISVAKGKNWLESIVTCFKRYKIIFMLFLLFWVFAEIILGIASFVILSFLIRAGSASALTAVCSYALLFLGLLFNTLVIYFLLESVSFAAEKEENIA